MTGPEAKTERFLDAKQKELDQWEKLKVYEVVPHRGQKLIDPRWVLTNKLVLGEKEMKAKARLCVKGFQDPDIDDIFTMSPTGGKLTWRVCIALCVQNNWPPNTIDVKTAFLQGEPLTRNVFMRAPPEMNLGVDECLKLLKAVYGLGDAPRKWYEAVKKLLTKFGLTIHRYDPGLFIMYDKEGFLFGFMFVHVDDFFYAGQKEFHIQIVASFEKVFPVGAKHKDKFLYLGMMVETFYANGKITEIVVDQIEYIKGLTPIPVEKGNKKLLHMNETLHSEFRTLVGGLSWVVTQSRPDLAFDVSTLASSLSSPNVNDLFKANKVLNKMQRSDVQLRFQYLRGELSLVGYADSSWANLPNGSTGGGLLWNLVENGPEDKQRFHLLTWRCRRLRRVCRSTFAAETLAAAEAMDELFLLKSLFNDTFGRMKNKNICDSPPTLNTDCRSLYDHVKNRKLPVSEKRLMVELSALSESVENGEVVLHWVPTDVQLADALTKHTASITLHNALRAGVWTFP